MIPHLLCLFSIPDFRTTFLLKKISSPIRDTKDKRVAVEIFKMLEIRKFITMKVVRLISSSTSSFCKTLWDPLSKGINTSPPKHGLKFSGEDFFSFSHLKVFLKFEKFYHMKTDARDLRGFSYTL